jgi:hypothetical protein
MESLIATLRRLLRIPVPAPHDAVVIDQAAYFDSLKLRQQRWREDEEEAERQRLRVALMVWEWARDVIRKRTKLPLPPKMPRNDVVRDWMNGLVVQEIFAMAQSNGFAIMHHIYGVDRIDGVRRVQPLPEATLKFPAPKIAPEDGGAAGGGGGPRRSKR